VNTEQKLFRVLAEVLKVDVASINETSSPDSIPTWDSLAMVSLVVELEQVFGVQFDILEIADFRNIAIIKTVLMEKGVEF
jgi:acyl carrier protein